MQQSLTLGGNTWPRILSFLSGTGMVVFSIMTIDHFYAANYPESIFEGSFCDISAFFNCDSSAYAGIAAIAGVPLGYLGLFVGALRWSRWARSYPRPASRERTRRSRCSTRSALSSSSSIPSSSWAACACCAAVFSCSP
jgi:hypothetical protein